MRQACTRSTVASNRVWLPTNPFLNFWEGNEGQVRFSKGYVSSPPYLTCPEWRF
jgi:hypothetical protein